jgi:hypothetical protein
VEYSYRAWYFQVLQSKGNQEFQAEPLTDHDSQVFDPELVERLPMQLVTCLDQVTGVGGGPQSLCSSSSSDLLLSIESVSYAYSPIIFTSTRFALLPSNSP